MANLASILRSKPTSVPTKPPSATGPMIEFVKENGMTERVHVRVRGKIATLKINRDDDGNMLSATLMKD